MPELTVSLVIFLVGVGLLTLAAAVTDVRSRRIPNALTVPFFFAGLVYQAVFRGWPGLGDAGLAFLLGFGTLLVLWLVGGGGGGDVKLMGALSAWLGLSLTMRVMVISMLLVIVGTGLVVLRSVTQRGMRKTKEKFIAQTTVTRGKKRGETLKSRQDRRVMAFAVPVALATWSVLLWKLPTL
jgi:prepilin peptidase CpaA